MTIKNSKMFYRIFFRKFSFPIIYCLIVSIFYFSFILVSFFAIYNNWSTDNHPGKVDWIIKNQPGTTEGIPTSEQQKVFYSLGFYQQGYFLYFVLIFIYIIPVSMFSHYLKTFYKSDYYKRIILLNGNKKTFRYIGLYLVIFWFLIFLIINLLRILGMDYIFKFNIWLQDAKKIRSGIEPDVGIRLDPNEIFHYYSYQIPQSRFTENFNNRFLTYIIGCISIFIASILFTLFLTFTSVWIKILFLAMLFVSYVLGIHYGADFNFYLEKDITLEYAKSVNFLWSISLLNPYVTLPLILKFYISSKEFDIWIYFLLIMQFLFFSILLATTLVIRKRLDRHIFL
ncbi:hypothetical protein [Mycoplasmopsis synoviae]|uniref:hypothetical protein n=1 Tax=Mycoplasmopsis synoviae TaxID=2109 RepID=UPI0034DB7453